MSEKLQLGFPLLGDPGNQLAARFKIVRTVPEELLETYRGMGIDLERVNGDASGTLPLPARYLIGQDGIIRHAAIYLDHTERFEPAETLTLLRGLQD
jgi:peroxiredoxin